MKGNETAGLVGRITETLAAMPDVMMGLTQELAPTGSERRARLALRIALMRQSGSVVPVPIPVLPPVPIDVTPLHQPEPPEAVEPPPAPIPPRAKPARVSMSTLGLEQAALLLAAAAGPSDPETPQPPVVDASPVLPDPETSEPKAPKMPKPGRTKGGSKDMGDAFAALATLGDATTEMPSDAALAIEAAPAEEAQIAKTESAPPKTRRRSGSVSAADGLANAAAALAAMQTADAEDAPDTKPKSVTQPSDIAAMMAGFAAFDEAE